jgi:VWFA-related protein
MKPQERQRPVTYLSIFVLLTSFLLPLFGVAFAQETRPISIRVRSEAVILDLIVTDRDGNLIRDLRPQDIEVYEDGKKQAIEFFSLAGEPENDRELLQTIETGVEARDPWSFSAPSKNPAIVILIDLGGIETEDVRRVRDHIEEFLLKHLESDTQYLLATTGLGLQIRQPFTTDPEKMRTALEGLQVVGSPGRFSYLVFLDELERIFEFRFVRDSFADFMQNVAVAIGKAATMLTAMEQRVISVTGDLRTLSSYLQQLPGRKHVVFYSSGYPLQPTATILDILRRRVESVRGNELTSSQRAELSARMAMLQKREMYGLMQSTLDQLNRSQVSVYAVDARGLLSLQIPPERRHSVLEKTGRQLHYASADLFEPQDFLVSLASGTGGISFLNNNDLERGLDAAYRDASQYYLLAYQPKSKRRKGKFHKIRVKVKRKDVNLRYRTGYIETPDEEAVRSEIYTALRHPWLYDGPDLRLEVETEGRALIIKTHFPTKALNFSSRGEELSCALEAYGVLVDGDGRWASGDLLFARQHHFQIQKSQLEELRKVDYVTSESSVFIPRDRGSTLVVVVRQGPTAEIASKVIKLGLEE